MMGESTSITWSMSWIRFSQLFLLVSKFIYSSFGSSSFSDSSTNSLTFSAVKFSRFTSFIGLVDGFSKRRIYFLRGLVFSGDTSFIAFLKLFLLLFCSFLWDRFWGLSEDFVGDSMFSWWFSDLRLFLLRLIGEFSFRPVEIWSFTGLMLFSFDIPDLLVFVGLVMFYVFDLRMGLFCGEVCIFCSDLSGLSMLLLVFRRCCFTFV